MPQSATGRPPITPRIRSVATSRAVTRMPLRDGSLLFSVSLVKFGGPPTDRAGWPWRLYSGATRPRLRRDRKIATVHHHAGSTELRQGRSSPRLQKLPSITHIAAEAFGFFIHLSTAQ